MSHLPHVISLKKELIKLDIVSPDAQNVIVSTAYTKALIPVVLKAKQQKTLILNEKNYLDRVLSYWNEITPINGFVIKNEITHFFNGFEKQLENLVGNVIEIPVCKTEETVDFCALEPYKELIECLKREATEFHVSFVETQRV